MNDGGNETQAFGRIWGDLDSNDHNRITDAVLVVAAMPPDIYAAFDAYMQQQIDAQAVRDYAAFLGVR